MTSTDWLKLNIADGGIAEIELARGPVNALSAGFLLDFAALISDLSARPDICAIVLTSRFKVFSAGLDLKEAQEFDLSEQNAIVAGLNIAFLRLFACPRPTVAAVNGAAIAGGLFFVLASDFRIAAPAAKFGLAEVRVGADFPVGPLEIARATLTPDMQRRLMLSGRPVTAEFAERAGLVDEIAPADGLRARALAAAAMLADSPPGTYATVKHQIRGAAIARIEAAMAAGANAPEGGWFTEETRSAMRRMIG